MKGSIRYTQELETEAICMAHFQGKDKVHELMNLVL